MTTETAPRPPVTQETQPPQPGQEAVDPIDLAMYKRERYLEVERDMSKPLDKRKDAREVRQQLDGAIGVLDEAESDQKVGIDPESAIRRKMTEINGNDTDGKRQLKAHKTALAYLTGEYKQDAESPHFQRWYEGVKKHRHEMEVKTSERELAAGRGRAEAQSTDSAQNAREKIKTLGREKLFGDVMDSSGVTLYTALTKDLSQTGYSGFSNIVEGLNAHGKELTRSVGDGFELRDDKNGKFGRTETTYLENGIQEAVSFEPVTKTSYEEVSTEVRGKFGIKRTETETISHTKNLTVGDVVEGVTDEAKSTEQAVKMVYRTFGNPDYTNSETAFLAEDGRDGNLVAVSIVMPKSLADKLKKAGIEDPNVIRSFVDKLAVEKAGIPEDAWYKGSPQSNGRMRRPPHEAWSKHHGTSKMYFKEPGDRQFDPTKIVEFKGAKKAA